MKKLWPFLILPLLVLACADGQKTNEDNTEETAEAVRTFLQNAHLNGNIKSITEMPYTPNEDGSVGDMDSCCIEIQEYSTAGFIVTETKKNSEGEVQSVYTEVRSDNGEYISGSVEEDGKEVWKRVIERDEEGTVVSAMDYDSSGQVYRIYTEIERNEFDQPVKGKSLDGDSTYLGVWSWQYIDGNRVGRGWVDSSGVQLVSRVGEVNDKGWVAKVMDVQVDQESGDTTTVVETYTYDSMDDSGNWTQRTQLNDGKAVKVVKRTYEYYSE